MALADVAITLNINNNVSYPIDMNILGNPANLRDNANATTQYQYDVTGFTFTNETNVVIQYKSNGSSLFSTFTQQLQSQNIQGVINALNLLGIGSFQTYTQGGQTYISTYNDNFTFGQLNIYTPSLINPDFFFGTGFDLGVSKILGYTGGTILVGGVFTTYNTTTSANGIILLNQDGTVNTSFNYGTGFTGGVGVVQDLAIQSDGKIIVVGDFTSYNGTPIVNIARLNTDGSLDTTFQNFGGFDAQVNSVAVQTNDYVICGGLFNNYTDSLGVNPCNFLARLTPNGAYDIFTAGTGFDSNVNVVTIQSDGTVLVGGAFTDYNGTPANRIIRLTTIGSVDATFVYGTGLGGGGLLYCAALYVLNNGDILIGGKFSDYDGNATNNLCKVSSTGTFDNTFIINSYGNIYASNTGIQEIQVDASGKIYIGGLFNVFNGDPNVGNIVRLNPDGSDDTAWTSQNSFTAFNGSVVATIDLYSSLTIIIGGNFSSFGGVPVYNILALKTF